jgi:hypothetical protein
MRPGLEDSRASVYDHAVHSAIHERGLKMAANSNEVLMGLEINHRTHQIQVKTMMRGKGRHTLYPTLLQAPEEVRGEALKLILAAVKQAGYESLSQLDAALSAPLALPEKDDTKEPKGKQLFANESIAVDDDEVELGGG